MEKHRKQKSLHLIQKGNNLGSIVAPVGSDFAVAKGIATVGMQIF